MELSDIKWTCHICKKERPDNKISVRQSPLIVNGRVLGNQNVRYCNDDSDCMEKSKGVDCFRAKRYFFRAGSDGIVSGA